MFNVPVHWDYANHKSASMHPSTTEPVEWFSHLPNSFKSLNFDFFVNWSDNTISEEIWIKLLVDKNKFFEKYQVLWPCQNVEVVQDALDSTVGTEKLLTYGKFGERVGLKAKYKVFFDSTNWIEYPAKFISLEIGENGLISEIEKLNLEEVKGDIQKLSGGEVTMRKPLKIATSKLERHLSSTKAVWPGDLDLLLLEEDEPIAIIEFKKNTISPEKYNHRKIINESLDNYYSRTSWAKDNRKYNRLAIFKEKLNLDIPIIILYYPVWISPIESENIIKVEKLTGGFGSLEVGTEIILPVPLNEESKRNIVSEIVTLSKMNR